MVSFSLLGFFFWNHISRLGFSFLYLAWAVLLGYSNVFFFFLIFHVPYWAIPWNVGNVYFIFQLCVLASCMMYVCVCVYIYIYLLVYGWSCTLYDGLPWLGEQPSHNCGCSWPYGVGMHSRRLPYMHIHAILSAWLSRCDCSTPCQLVTLVSPCMRHALICLMLSWVLTRLNMNMLKRAEYIGKKPCRCTIAHETWNSVEFSLWKWGTFVALFSQRKLGENIILCAMMH